MLGDHIDAPGLSARLLEAEKRNLQHYGFGIKGFTLSMIETAVEVTEGRVPGEVIARILAIGRDMLSHPVETLPHARETLEALAASYRLVLITKGDLFDQERKLAGSGLGELFEAVEIVSDKRVTTYSHVFSRYGDGPERSMMVGNSLKSDVVPAIEAGSWGVYIPHDLTWVIEHVEAPEQHPRFRQIVHLGELPDLIGRDRRALKACDDAVSRSAIPAPLKSANPVRSVIGGAWNFRGSRHRQEQTEKYPLPQPGTACRSMRNWPGSRHPATGQSRAASADRQIDRLRTLAALVRLGIESHFLSIFEARKARRLHGRDVDEDILRPVIRRDEAETFGMVEEFDSAGLRHGKLLHSHHRLRRAANGGPHGFGRSLEEKKQFPSHRSSFEPSRSATAPGALFGRIPGIGHSGLRARKTPEP